MICNVLMGTLNPTTHFAVIQEIYFIYLIKNAKGHMATNMLLKTYSQSVTVKKRSNFTPGSLLNSLLKNTNRRRLYNIII